MSLRLDKLEEELGLDARRAAEDFAAEMYVLTFQENRRGGDPVAHTPDGKTVFPDKFRGGTEITVGDTWICGVASKGGSTFFAAPLRRIDTAFFADLASDQMDRIVAVAVEHHRDALRPLIEAAFERHSDTAAKDRVMELIAERDAVEGQLKDLVEQYDDAAQRLRRYELEVRTLREQLEQAETNEEVVAKVAPAGFQPFNGAPLETGTVTFERVAAEIVESQALTAERYYGHISPDHRKLFLKAHVNGNLPCVNGRLHIPGLDRVVPYGGRAGYAGHFDPRHGGWFVKV